MTGKTDTVKVDLPTTHRDTTAMARTELTSLRGYQLVSGVPSFLSAIDISATTDESVQFPIPNLVPGSYGFVFSCVNAGGEGDLSAVYPVVIKAPVSPPAAPTIESDAQS